MRPFLNRREAADYLTNERGLKTSWRTLQKKATVGGGPPYRIFGNRAVYEPSHLDKWSDEELTAIRRSTSEIRSEASSDTRCRSSNRSQNSKSPPAPGEECGGLVTRMAG